MQRIKTVEAVDDATLFVRAIGKCVVPEGDNNIDIDQ